MTSKCMLSIVANHCSARPGSNPPPPATGQLELCKTLTLDSPRSLSLVFVTTADCA